MPIHARVPRDWSPRVQLVLLLVLHGVQVVFAAVPGRRENQRDAVDGHTDAAAHGAEAVVERDGEADSRGGLRPTKRGEVSRGSGRAGVGICGLAASHPPVETDALAHEESVVQHVAMR